MTPDAAIARDAEVLIAPWPGPCGGLPPFDRASPAAIEAALELAIARKRAKVRAIAAETAEPTFANTILALEDCGRELAQAQCFLTVYRSTMLDADFEAMLVRILPLLSEVEDEVAHNTALFARVDRLHAMRDELALCAIDARLLDVIRERFVRAGAALASDDQQELAETNARLAALQSTFSANLIAAQSDAIILTDERDLDGLELGDRRRAAEAARTRGHDGSFAIVNSFEAVWPFLSQSHRRDLRERVWRMSDERCITEGPHDNRPIAAEILQLRARKARLLGYPDYARYVMADRMQTDPLAVLALIDRVWTPVRAATDAQLLELQDLARAEHPGITLAPWDRRYYLAKYRKKAFAFNAEALRPYLTIDNVLAAMFQAASNLLNIELVELRDQPVCHPTVRVFELRRDGTTLGVLYLDVVPRPGKMRGSWQAEYRSSESGEDRVLPIASLNSNPPAAADGKPTLLGWEHATVFFHEFGHALHMLCNRAPYRSLGSMAVAWDFIELPSLLNERWLLDRKLLKRFCRHHETGQPIPDAMLDGLEAALRYDRAFTLTLDALVSSIVDLRLHMLGGDSPPDVLAIEREVLAERDVPEAIDLIQHAAASFHIFGGGYAAGFYSYLWSDVMAADIAEAFLESPGGLYDRDIARRYENTLLSVGNTLPAASAFRAARGRDPDPAALLKRFGLSLSAHV